MTTPAEAIPADLLRLGERILTGTGLSIDDAAAVAAGATAPEGVPASCLGALRDGWATAHAPRPVTRSPEPEVDPWASESGGEPR